MGTIKWGSFITGHLLGQDRRDFLHKAGQGQQFGNASPQFGRRGEAGAVQSGVVDANRPGNWQFGASAVRQFDQVGEFRVGLISGPAQNLNNLIG